MGDRTPESGEKKVSAFKKLFQKHNSPSVLEQAKRALQQLPEYHLPLDHPVARACAESALYVKLIGGSGLRAMDSNGLSDPYVVLHVGEQRSTSNVQAKTLSPVWNETFIFAPSDLIAAIQDGSPWVELRVYDKDLLSADDFMGRVELPLSTLDAVFGSNGPLTLELHGERRPSLLSQRHHLPEPQHGSLQVSVWFGAAAERAGGTATTTLTLMPQPGEVAAPKLLHCGGSCLYEEPLFCGVVIDVQGLSDLSRTSPGGTPSGETPPGSPPAPDSPKSLLGRWRQRRERAKERRHGGGGGGGGGGDGADLDEAELEVLDPYGEGDGWGEGWDESASMTSGGDADADPLSASGRHDARGRAVSWIYCRLLLGQQSQVTKVVRERAHGHAAWRQKLAFAVPLPLRDRSVRVEVYRTSSVQSKGRAVHAGAVPLLALLPAIEGLEPDLTAEKKSHVPMVTLPSGAQTIMMRLSAAVVDLDGRRSLYGQPLVEPPDAAAGAGGSGAGDMSRLQSATPLLRPRDMKHMAKLTEDEVTRWQEHRERRAHAAEVVWNIPGHAATFATSWAGWGYGQTVAVAGWGASAALRMVGVGLGPEAPAEAPAEDAGAEAAPPPAPAAPLPQPLACLHLELRSLALPRDTAGSLSYLFCIIKVGANWMKTPVRAASEAAEGEWRWEVTCPVLDPSTVLLLAVFNMNFKSGTRRKTTVGGRPQMVGKLRVRLSTLAPDRSLTSQLPLLASRDQGGKRVGNATLSMRLAFTSPAARLKAYFAPALPSECYDHGADADALQAALDAERRRMVLRWLDAAAPPVPRDVALAVLDTGREEFARSRLSANGRRVQLALAVLGRAKRFKDKIESWEDLPLSLGACVVCVGLAYLPRLFVPGLLAYAAVACVRAKPPEAGLPVGMEEDADGAAEELEAEERELDAEVASFRVLTRRYLSLKKIVLRVQNALDDMASVLERVLALFSWADPTATWAAVGVLVGAAIIVLLLGTRFVQAFVMLFVIRPPALRTPTPPPPAALFGRLPTRADRIM